MIIKFELRLNWYQYFTTVAFISPDSLHASLLNLTLGKINNSEYKAFFLSLAFEIRPLWFKSWGDTITYTKSVKNQIR